MKYLLSSVAIVAALAITVAWRAWALLVTLTAAVVAALLFATPALVLLAAQGVERLLAESRGFFALPDQKLRS